MIELNLRTKFNPSFDVQAIFRQTRTEKMSIARLENALMKREKSSAKDQHILKRHDYFLKNSKEHAKQGVKILKDVEDKKMILAASMNTRKHQAVWTHESERLENARYGAERVDLEFS